MNELADQIATWLKTYATNAGADGYVVGLSGGVDSAVAAALAVQGMGRGKVYGLIMPCYSIAEDQMYASRVARWLGIKHETVTLDYPFTSIAATVVPPATEVRQDRRKIIGNIKARLRMITLYAFANRMNYLVLGTGNRTELKLGYFTKYGDGGVDVLPLGDLYKSEVWGLAEELGVPQEVIDKPPSAGLWEGQTDEGEIGATYEQMERWLRGNPMGLDEEAIKKLCDLEAAARHKLELPPIFRRFPSETED